LKDKENNVVVEKKDKEDNVAVNDRCAFISVEKRSMVEIRIAAKEKRDAHEKRMIAIADERIKASMEKRRIKQEKEQKAIDKWNKKHQEKMENIKMMKLEREKDRSEKDR